MSEQEALREMVLSIARAAGIVVDQADVEHLLVAFSRHESMVNDLGTAPVADVDPITVFDPRWQ